MGVVATTTKPKGFFYYIIMAENKKSFVIYCDLIHTIRKMKKEDIGELFLHILEYTNDLNPVTENAIVDIVFEPIKQQMKRDLKSWEETKEGKSLNGRKGNLKRYHPDLFIQYEAGMLSLSNAEKIAKLRKESLSDKNLANVAVTVNDTVTVNVTDNDILLKEKENFSNELFNDDQWNEDVCRMNKINSDALLKYLDKFDLKLKTELIPKYNKQEYASHFSRWLILEIEKEKKQTKNQKEKLTGAQAFLKQFE